MREREREREREKEREREGGKNHNHLNISFVGNICFMYVKLSTNIDHQYPGLQICNTNKGIHIS